MVWAYEVALREQCGYNGSQPYWAWDLDGGSPQTSPVFDGSEYSMSGDGAPVPHAGLNLTVPGFATLLLPPGTGGGCVMSGPFKNLSVNLGPIGLPGVSPNIGPDGDASGYNPRCLKRDLNAYIASRWATAGAVKELLTAHDDIGSFQMAMQGSPGSPELGVHSAGHNLVGGDPSADMFTSPGDPIFYLHHAQIDRLWWLWQAQDPASRQYALSGTGTYLNQPASPNVTIQDSVDLSPVAPASRIQDLMTTVSGPFCYRYE
ncbi:MAG: hypothetical protein M1838_003337 [Thelocarpon superellum]|nr:MAG: hypothetical protein M1838_003337 [Thelocarpon superellum]